MHRNYSKNLKHKEYKIKTGDFIFHLKKRWKVDYYLQLTSILVAILWNMRNPKKKEKKMERNEKGRKKLLLANSVDTINTEPAPNWLSCF